MKKKLYMLMLTIVMVVCVCGCKKEKKEETTDTKNVLKEDIVEFVNTELPAIKDKRDTAIGIYNSYFSSESKDLKTFLSDLNTKALPGMEEYITELSAIEVATSEVSNLKDLYLQSSRKQYEAMVLVVSAIEGENPNYLSQADSLIAESEALLIQFDSQLKLLSSENNITINGSFLPAN